MAAQTLAPSIVPGGAAAAKPEWKENLTIQAKCPECKEDPPNVIEEFSSGDTVCASCGLVIGERIIDTRSEWRTFSNDDQGNDDPSRVGEAANPLLNGSQLQTTISFGDGIKSRELARAQNKSINGEKSNKGLLTAYKEIGAYCDAYSIPSNAANLAKTYFKLVTDSGTLKGKSQDAIIAGCIFLACRAAHCPRSFREIHAMTKVPKPEIGKVFKMLKVLADKENKKMEAFAPGGATAKDNSAAAISTDAKELCGRFCSHLMLGTQCTNLSQDIAIKLQSGGALAGRSPLSVAAACIYMASHLLGTPKSPKEISTVAGVSDGTIRTAYKMLYKERDGLLEGKWLLPGKVDMKKLPVG